MHLKKEFLASMIARSLPRHEHAEVSTGQIVNPLDDASFIDSLYRKYLHRQPDATGMAFYIERLESGVPRSKVREEIEQSEEAGNARTVVHQTPYPSGLLARLYHFYSKIWQLHRLDRLDRKQDLIMQQTERMLEKQASRQSEQAANLVALLTESQQEFPRIAAQFSSLLQGASAKIQELEERLTAMEASSAWRTPAKVVACGPYLFGFPAIEWRLAAYVEHRGHPEPGTLKIVQRYLREGMSFVDVGASFGLLTIPAATAVGKSGFVQAWEPDPVSFEMLTGNVQLNNLLASRTIDILPYAAGLRASTTKLYTHASSRTYSTLIPRETGVWQEIDVEVRTLDAMLNGRKVDLLKIDAEGFEPQVIGGLAEVIKEGRVSAIILEFSPTLLLKAKIEPAVWLATLCNMASEINEIDESSGDLVPLDIGQVLNKESVNIWMTLHTF